MSKTSTRYKRCELLFLQRAASLTGAAIPTLGLLFPLLMTVKLNFQKKHRTKKPPKNRKLKTQGGRGIKMKEDGPWGRRE